MKKAYVTVYAVIITVILFTVIAVLLNGSALMKRNNSFKKERIQAQFDVESDAVEVVQKIDLINQQIVNHQYGLHQITSVKGHPITYQLIREKNPKKKYKYSKYIAIEKEKNDDIVNAMITFKDRYDLEKEHWTLQEMEEFLSKGVKKNNRDTVHMVDYPAVIIGKDQIQYVAHRDQFFELRERLKKEHDEKFQGIPYFVDPEKEEQTFGEILEEHEEIQIPPYKDDYDRMIDETIDGQSVFVAVDHMMLNSEAEFLGEEPFFKGVLFDNGNISSHVPVAIDGILLLGNLHKVEYQLHKGVCITESGTALQASDQESSIIPKLNACEEVEFKAISIR